MSGKFYDRHVAKRDLKKAKGFLNTFEVSVRFSKKTNRAAVWNSTVTIATDKTTVSQFWSAIFHELVHILSYREGKYSAYHRPKPTDMSEKTYNNKLRRVGLRAELYVDRRAQKMMKGFFSNIPYDVAYQDNWSRKWYRDWLDKNYPKEKING